MITLGLFIRKFFDLMQAKLNGFFEMPIEVTDGCLIMGNGDIVNNDINTNTLYFHYNRLAEQERERNKIFGEIIEMLDRIEDYEEEIIVTGTSADNSLNPFNIIPYGSPSECHKKLVVIVDGKKDIGFIITKALLHVGMVCKVDTSYVLFYIKIDKAQWDEMWALYEPAFNKLENEKHIRCFFDYKK